MRKLVLGVLSAAALGLMIAPAATAAPADGLAIKRGANAATLLEDVRWCRTRRWAAGGVGVVGGDATKQRRLSHAHDDPWRCLDPRACVARRDRRYGRSGNRDGDPARRRRGVDRHTSAVRHATRVRTAWLRHATRVLVISRKGRARPPFPPASVKMTQVAAD